MSAVLGAVAASLGGVTGALWYVAFGPPWGQLGYEFEGFAETLRGATAGLLAGSLAGWFLPVLRPPRSRSAPLLVLGSATAAVLFVIGLSYLGRWTNADGPGEVAAYLGVLGLPASVVAAFLLRRLTTRACRHRGDPRGEGRGRG